MKIIYGTGNTAKLSEMKRKIDYAGLDLEIVGLKDLVNEGYDIPEVLENGKTPLENAIIKAEAYYKAIKMPVFSCDSGLYFAGVPDEVQPGVHVRTIDGKYLSDKEMIIYYSSLARQYGTLVATYKNAICLKLNENQRFEKMDSSIESKQFFIVEKPHSFIKKGFPLDSLSVDIDTGKYYYDLKSNKIDEIDLEDGFIEFFREVLERS